jgi:hypothetical protein
MVPARLRVFWPGSLADGALIFALLVVFCLRFWNLGIVFHDDAMWALWAHVPGEDPVGDFARIQARLWGFPAGTLMLHALAWQGTLYGEILRVGSFVLFFSAFHVFVAIYCGRQIMLLSACLFFALFALRWDASVLTAAPLLSWVPATAFIAAALFGRAYVVYGKSVLAVAAGLFLTLSLLTNEGVALLFCTLFPITLIGNLTAIVPGGSLASEFMRPSRTRKLLMICLILPAIYVMLALVWALGRPSLYAGHAIAPFDLSRVAIIVLEFSTSNSLLHDFVKPYFVRYTDHITELSADMLYKPSSFLPVLQEPASLMFGFAMAFLFCRAADGVSPASVQKLNTRYPEFLALALGLVIAIVPIVPVALTAKYQQWYFEQGVMSYGQAILGYFGISLFLAAIASIILRLFGRRGQKPLVVALMMMVGVLAATSYRMNDAIALDMRPESGRWRVVALALKALDAAQIDTSAIWAPRFKNGSWYATLPASYWSDYAKARHNANIRFLFEAPWAETVHNTAYLDYMLADDGRSFVAVIERLEAVDNAGTRAVMVNKVAVAFEQPSATQLESYLLSFTDDKGIWRKFQLKALEQHDEGVWSLDQVSAVPGSIRVSRLNATPPATKLIADRKRGVYAIGDTIDFSREGESDAVVGNGWAGQEDKFRWTLGTRAEIRFILRPSPAERFVLRFAGSAFLSASRPQQSVVVLVNDRETARFTFQAGEKPPDMTVPVEASRLGPDRQVSITLLINDPRSPKELGLSGDDRALGILLQSISIESPTFPTGAR